MAFSSITAAPEGRPMLTFPRTFLLAVPLAATLACPALAEDDGPTREVLLCGGGDAAEERQCILIDGDSASFVTIDLPADESFEADPVPLPPLA